ncbi:MAG: hypothetical protein JO040_04840 [Gemmatimonadetes bacterium]|nr:hypothetical protein [Gemmatimonadota bacterium]
MKDKSLLSTLLTWLAVGVLAIIALKVVFALLGVTLFLVAIAFKLLPILLAVWLVMLVVRWFRKDRGPGADPMDL